MHVSLLLAFSIAYCAIVVIYRLYFHPLRAVPGPRLGAVSGWYQAYHDIWKDGYFTTHLKDLHNIYGAFGNVRFLPRSKPNTIRSCRQNAPERGQYPFPEFPGLYRRSRIYSYTSAVLKHISPSTLPGLDLPRIHSSTDPLAKTNPHLDSSTFRSTSKDVTS